MNEAHSLFSRRLSRGQLILLDLAAGLGFVLVFFTAAANAAEMPVWVRIAVPLGLGWPLALRRVWPIPVFCLTLALAVIAAPLQIVGFAYVSPAYALYVVAMSGNIGVMAPTSAIGVVSLFTAFGLVVAGSTPTEGAPSWLVYIDQPLIGIAALGGAWTIGRAVRERRLYTARDAELLAVQAVTEERLRIARELHDVITHSVGLIAVKAGVANHVMASRPEEAHDALRVIETASRSALVEMRHLLGVLRSTEVPDLVPAPGLDGLDGLAQQARLTGVEVVLDVRVGRGESGLSESGLSGPGLSAAGPSAAGPSKAEPSNAAGSSGGPERIGSVGTPREAAPGVPGSCSVQSGRLVMGASSDGSEATLEQGADVDTDCDEVRVGQGANTDLDRREAGIAIGEGAGVRRVEDGGGSAWREEGGGSVCFGESGGSASSHEGGGFCRFEEGGGSAWSDEGAGSGSPREGAGSTWLLEGADFGQPREGAGLPWAVEEGRPDWAEGRGGDVGSAVPRAGSRRDFSGRPGNAGRGDASSWLTERGGARGGSGSSGDQDVERARLPSGVELAIYRIVQEALTNVVKHAAPARCHVSVVADERAACIEVVDDGPGKRTLSSGEGTGQGLIGMRERVAMYGGEFEAGRRPGRGFRVYARLPYAEMS